MWGRRVFAPLSDSETGVGGESNPRRGEYESPVLPLNYPHRATADALTARQTRKCLPGKQRRSLVAI